MTTGRLGTSQSQLGNIVLGSVGGDTGGDGTISAAFTADAVIQSAGGTISGSFTADSILLRTESGALSADSIFLSEISGSLTADAVLKTLQSETFTADAVLATGVATIAGSFTADSVLLRILQQSATADGILKSSATSSFNASAYFVVATPSESFTADSVFISAPVDNIFTAHAVLASIPIDPDQMRITKRVSMSVLQRRPLEFSAYVPPKVPDEEEEDPEPEPHCLPPCAPFGAGGSQNGWGSFKIAMTQCNECNVYFRNDAEFLGNGSNLQTAKDHYGTCGSHQAGQHVTKLWVRYPSIPDGKFLMRAKMTWDQNGPDFMGVSVYSVDTFPEYGEGEGTASFGEWNSGTMIDKFMFLNDAEIHGYVLLGQTQYKYQEEPSTIILDGAALNSTTFRFQIDDEDTFYNAKFRASNLEWP